MLQRYLNKELSHIISPVDSYHPLPTAKERDSWNKVPRDLKNQITQQGMQYLDFNWPILPAVRYMDYLKTGDRTQYENIYFARRKALGLLVMAESLEGNKRYLNDIVNGIWCICEESTWVLPAHNNHLNPGENRMLPDITNHYIDLMAAETGAQLAWTYYLLKEELGEISPQIIKRIRYEIQSRILKPYMKHDDFWWMGLDSTDQRPMNNWNPWCNSGCLTAILLMEEDEDQRIQAVAKCMKSLDQFIKVYCEDGGCDEGPNYWETAGGSLFDCLDLLYGASSGKINIYDVPLIQNMGKYIYFTHIDKDYFINFADGRGRFRIPAGLIYRYGRQIRDEHLARFGALSFQEAKEFYIPGWSPMFRSILNLLNAREMSVIKGPMPYKKDVWLESIQVMAAREQDDNKGLYLAAKGGYNDEGHNHNDVGQFIVYANGDPILIDAGVGTYTAKTFGTNRYSIWTMQSAYHNLPTINGYKQKEGTPYRAEEVKYTSSTDLVKFSLDISNAYPKEAKIHTWQRNILFHRNKNAYIELQEIFELKEYMEKITLSLMTPCRCQIQDPGTIRLYGQQDQIIELTYDENKFDLSIEPITLEDQKLRSVWGKHIFRLLFTGSVITCKDSWNMKIVQISE